MIYYQSLSEHFSSYALSVFVYCEFAGGTAKERCYKKYFTETAADASQGEKKV